MKRWFLFVAAAFMAGMMPVRGDTSLLEMVPKDIEGCLWLNFVEIMAHPVVREQLEKQQDKAGLNRFRELFAKNGLDLYQSLEDVFARADVVSLHCPLTAENEGLVGTRLLDLMRPHAFLINTARGGLVREADLAAALNAGRIAGAAVDVVSAEPIRADNPLLAVKNCLLTPHIAWATVAARRRLMETTARNIEAFLRGAPIHIVN